MISLMQLNPGIFSAAFIQLFICFYSALLASQGYPLNSFSAAYILVDFQTDHQLLLLAVALPSLEKKVRARGFRGIGFITTPSAFKTPTTLWPPNSSC